MLKHVNDDENDLLMETMRDNVALQHEPKVGMFWFNPERNRLIGVSEAFASELPFNSKGRKTVRVLHHTAWPGVREDALASGSTDAIYREEDYTRAPRGRVFQIEVPGSDVAYFEVLVGSWIFEHPAAKKLIIDRFNLAQAEFEFIHSEHWDIGHGTSEIFISEG